MEWEYTLEKLEVYQMAEEFSDEIWFIVEQWNYFKKDTIVKLPNLQNLINGLTN
jgi:hypothetical protein